MVLNDMVKQVEDDPLDPLFDEPKVDKKNIYNEQTLNNPRVKEAIKHARRAGEL